ncbi:MAG: pilus assembly protein TadG-related protein, partial [Planctomycetota bacterium]|nr:pilus assembly protein TadG-related protein [Planctomycetota bacterium]
MAKRRGISSIKLLVGLPAIILVAWLSIEIGLAYRAVQQATNGADAAALAAAARLPDGWEAMREDAILAASANPGPT